MAYVLSFLGVVYPIAIKGKQVVYEKDNSADKKIAEFRRLAGFEEIKKKNGINKMEKSIMKSKKECSKNSGI